MEQGDPLDIELIVTDVDGKAVADRPIKVRAVRLAWEFVDGEWKEVEKDEQICDVTSQEEPVKCSFDGRGRRVSHQRRSARRQRAG